MSVQWMNFLYRVSHSLYEKYGSCKAADQVYYLNKIMHGNDWFYAIKLPVHFHCEHPFGFLGTVEFFFGLSAARAFPILGQICESNTVMLIRIIDIAADRADILSGSSMRGKVKHRPYSLYRVIQVHHPLFFQVFVALRVCVPQ